MNGIYKPDEWNYLKLEFKENINNIFIEDEIKKEKTLNNLNSLKKKRMETLNDIDNLNSRINKNLMNNKDLRKKKQFHCIIL
jgi:hypothetical protein